MRTNVHEILDNFDDAKRLVAKLMARENITVQVVDGLSTAYFDTASRVLALPNWSTLTMDQFDMLIGHEVGHALFTDNKYIETIVGFRKTHPGLMSYFNVVEDARIERKMKNVYPGLAKHFYAGYKHFTENGPLFKLKDDKHVINSRTREVCEIATMKLIDRINLFFKIGAFVQVPFDKKEHVWIHRINKCADVADALQIAKELHEYAKEKELHEERKRQRKQQRKQQKQAGAPQSGDGTAEEGEEDEDAPRKKSKSKKQDQNKDEDKDESKPKPESGDGDEEADDDELSEPEDDGDETDSDSVAGEDEEDDADEGDEDEEDDDASSGANDPIEPIEDPVASTDEDIQNALKQLADQNAKQSQLRHLLYGVLSDDALAPRIVTAKNWSESAYSKMRVGGLSESELQAALDVLENVWNSQFLQTAKVMAAEFDRRKTAKNYQRAQESKTGRLDMTKLHQYKFAEDLFRRTTTIPNGQSHGLAMIVDGSSSMTDVFAAVMDQALLFAAFCFYARIPCEIYLFSDIHHIGGPHRNGILTLNLAPKGQLVGLINTVTDRASFRQQFRACLALKARFKRESGTSQKFQDSTGNIPYSSLSGTPLYTGIMLAEAVVGRMKRSLNLDKVTFAVVSDGGDTDGVYFEDNKVDPNNGRVYKGLRNINECGGMVVRDIVTKANHIYVSGGKTPRMPTNGPLTMLMDMVKYRHGAQTVYFFLSEGYDMRVAVDVHVRDQQGVKMPSHTDVSVIVREQGQFVFPAGAGVADLTMILPTDKMALKGDDYVGVPTKGGDVVEQYVDVLKDRANSRKFVNAVVPYIA